MTITYHRDLIQGTDEWHAARCGVLTASEICLIVTPAKLQAADNKDSRGHLLELLAQSLTRYVEPTYQSADMERGTVDEVEARRLYSKHFAPVEECGFIVNDKLGFPLGFSPDGLVGDDGLIESKSRKQKYQVDTIIKASMPADYLLQVQAGLLISERKWCDFISYSAGLPMMVLRVEPDPEVQAGIVRAAMAFHQRMQEMRDAYHASLVENTLRLIPTERPTLEITDD